MWFPAYLTFYYYYIGQLYIVYYTAQLCISIIPQCDVLMQNAQLPLQFIYACHYLILMNKLVTLGNTKLSCTCHATMMS